jgi:hypothetical protein
MNFKIWPRVTWHPVVTLHVLLHYSHSSVILSLNLNSLSSGTDRFEDLPDLARLLFDDATESSIAARYSNAVQSGEKLALELCSHASNK